MCRAVKIGILHYSVAPVVGGVESVIDAHARLLIQAGFSVRIITGRGDAQAQPEGVELTIVPEMDTRHPAVEEVSRVLERGAMPDTFEKMRTQLVEVLYDRLRDLDVLFVHNVFTKHFNLPLTAALFDLLDLGAVKNVISWVHDLTWTSANSRSKVFPGFPWDLLRSLHPSVRPVAISVQRQAEMAELLKLSHKKIPVVYSGVDPQMWLGLGAESWRLVEQMDLLNSDLNLIMPVRITQAKNVELAARVLAAIKERIPNCRLVVTGPPDPHSASNKAYFSELQTLRAALDLDKALCFVYEHGQNPGEPCVIEHQTVVELMRASDVMFLPSHREGFGIPVLEAGLVGLPIVSSANVPAACEIGGRSVRIYPVDSTPEEIAAIVVRVADQGATRFRRQVRQQFTWQHIFDRDILPLLETA